MRWKTISLFIGAGLITVGIGLQYGDAIMNILSSDSAPNQPKPAISQDRPTMPNGSLLSQRLQDTRAQKDSAMREKLLNLQISFNAVQKLLGLNWSFPDILLRGEAQDHRWVLLVFAPNQPMPIGDCAQKTFVDSRMNKAITTTDAPRPSIIHAGGDAITCQRLQTFDSTPALHHALNQWKQQSVATVTLDDWVEAPLWATRTVPISLPNTVLDKSGVVQITQLLRHTTAFATREMDDLYYRKNLENFVALVGAQQWVHQKLSDTEAQRYDEELAQRKMFYQFANEYRQKIAFLMTSAITADEKNFRIRTLLSDMQTAYEGIKPQLTSAKVYDDWITQELHYGHLWLMGMQSEYFFAFERLLEESDHNMVIFFAKALELGKLSYDERIKTLRGYQTKVERDPDVRNVFNGQ